MNRRITAVDLGRQCFQNAFKSLPESLKEQVIEAIKALKTYPQPNRLRLEKLSGYSKPNIYTIHVTSNHSHKLSFELVGEVAVLRKIGTHKQIDRAP